MDLSRHQGALLIAGILAGLGLSGYDSPLMGYSDLLVGSGLFIVLLSIMATVSLENLGRAARNRRFFSAALSTNFIAVPILAFIIALIFLGDEPALLLGLVMYLVTPCTDWFLAFTRQAGGDSALGTVLLPWNLLLQILLLPLYVLLIAGAAIPVGLADFKSTLLLFFVLPLLLSRVVRRLVKAREVLEDWASNLQTGALTLVVLAMFASQGGEILENLFLFPRALAAVLVFFTAVFLVARGVSSLAGLPREEYVLLNFTASARNSPIALAVALGVFPTQPLIAAVILLGPLVELPVLALEARLLGPRA